MNFRNHRRRREEQADLEITPLIDVVFLLLIFFMLTSSFARQESGPTDRISVELPRATAASEADERVPIMVVVQSDGAIQVRGLAGDGVSNDSEDANAGGSESGAETVSETEALLSILREVRGKRPNAPILLTGDRRASHGRIVELLGTLREAGFREVQIATQPE